MSTDNQPSEHQQHLPQQPELEMAEVGARAIRLLGQEQDRSPEADINKLGYPLGYFDAQVQFAQKWSDITGEDFTKVLLDKTGLYRRVWGKRPPEDFPDEWYGLVGDLGADTNHDVVAGRLYNAYKEKPHSAYDRPADKPAFGYEYHPEIHTVKIHFSNPVRGESPFSEENVPRLREQFKTMLEDVLVEHPDAKTLMSASWIRSTRGYRNMSPPDIAEQESLMSPDMAFGGDSVWGQFLDRNGNTNRRVYDQFVEAVSKAQTVDELLEAFPYKVLRAQDPIEKYYDYYRVKVGE